MTGIIDEILDALSEETLQILINDPIDRAVKTFPFRFERVDSHRAFILILGAFIQHLYKQGLRAPRNLADAEAQEEALWFLERHYRGEHVQGFEGACLDAMCGSRFGLEGLLDKIAAIQKDQERQKYISWVLTSNIDPSDWQLRMQLTEEYIHRHGRLWPVEVQAFKPFQLALSLEDLLLVHASTTPILSPHSW